MSVKCISSSLGSPRLNPSSQFLSVGLGEGPGEAGGDQVSFRGSRERCSRSHTQGIQVQSHPVSLHHEWWWDAGSLLSFPWPRSAGTVPLPVPCAGREPGRASVRYGLHKPHLLGHCTQPGFLLYFLRLACSLVAWAHSCWPSLRSTLDPVQRSWDYTTWYFQVGLPEAVGELCCSPSWWCFL